MPEAATPEPARYGETSSLAVSVAMLALIGVGVLLSAHLGSWSLGPLIVVAAFAMGSDLMAVRTDMGDALISGSFLGIIVIAVLDGGAQAALVGLATVLVGWLRSRERSRALAANLANLAWVSLITGLGFHALVAITGCRECDPVFLLLVFLTFMIGLATNIVLFAACAGRRSRVSPIALVREMLHTVLAAELFAALLTVVAVYVTLHLHLAGLISFGLVLAIFQYLVGELLTSRRRSAKLRRLATTDELTGLGNRDRFRREAEQRIASGDPFCVLLMDLDRFKEVNDTLGHAYGDRLLQDLGPRLVRAIGPSGFVARLGGDEFAVLLAEDGLDPLVVEVSVAALLATVSEPFAVDELSLEVGASIGLARFPDDGGDAGTLLRCADIAMYAAKDAQTDYKLYDAEQHAPTVQRLNVLSDIRRALGGGEIVVHYQPIVDVDSGDVRGAEALVRWEHPEHGLIPPGAFVQIVEQTGLIGPLTRHVLALAVAECAGWRRDGRDLSVAVNLSVRNLLDRDLPAEIERLLELHEMPADALQLEITESMIMSDPERALATVGRLSALGVRLSVDDFGTGYSSLANLRRLPIDELKIDRSFVSPMLKDESDLIIVRSTINLGHDLGLRIIAEGVEDSDTLEHLGMLGCDLAQGYHLSRPLPAAAFTRWLADAAQRPLAQNSVA